MTVTVCGHDREALRWALATRRDESELMCTLVIGAMRRNGDVTANERWVNALADVNDPAKLAALIADGARRCGLDAYADPTPDSRRLPCWTIWSPCFGNAFTINHLDDAGYVISSAAINHSQARAILAALLQLPDGAREVAERVLRGELEQRHG